MDDGEVVEEGRGRARAALRSLRDVLASLPPDSEADDIPIYTD